VKLGHLGIKGYLLACKLIISLSPPLLGIDLSGAGSLLLLLLVGLLLIEEELHSWLGHHRPHHDRRDGLESRSALQDWCGK
jgi:hypothetical protein